MPDHNVEALGDRMSAAILDIVSLSAPEEDGPLLRAELKTSLKQM